MNVRLTAILFGVVLTLVAALLVSVLLDDRPAKDEILLAALAGAKDEDVVTVELQRGAEKLVAVRKGRGQWEFTQPVTAAAEGFQIEGIVRDVLRLKPVDYADIPGPAAAGVEPAAFQITLRTNADKSATLRLGDTTAGKDKAVTFAANGDRPGTVVAVRRADLDSLFKSGTGAGKTSEHAKWLTDYRRRRLLGADLRDAVTDLKQVKLTRGGKTLILDRTDAGDWIISSPANYGAADVAGDPNPNPAEFTGVRPLLSFLTGLTTGGNEDYLETPQPLETYGLKDGDPNLLRIELTPKTGAPEVLLVGKKDDKPGPTKVFVKTPLDPSVAIVQTAFDPLFKTLADPKELRDRTLVSDLKKELIDAVDISAGGTAAKLRRVDLKPERQWALYGGPTDPQLAAFTAKELIDAITKPRAAADVLPPSDPAVTPPVAELKLWYSGTKPGDGKEANGVPPEPKLSGDAAVTLILGKTENGFAAVKRVTPAGATFFKIPAATAEIISRGRLAYIRPKSEPLASNTAVKLAFNRGGEAFEIVKADKPDPDYPVGKWTFEKPDRLRGQIADADKVGGGTGFAGAGLIGLVGTLAPDAVAAENPTPAQLKQFGLDPPVCKVQITVDTEKDKPREYWIGGPAKDGFVYCRTPNSPLVVTVLKAVADRFAADDLRDLTLYRVAPASITGIKLRGWKKATGAVQEVELKREAGGWKTVKGPAGFAADAGRVDVFAASFAGPKPLRSIGPGLKPEYGFDVPNAANTLEVTLEVNGKPLVVLTLGEEIENGYYAACNMKGDEAFVVPQFQLKPFKDGPTGFRKP